MKTRQINDTMQAAIKRAINDLGGVQIAKVVSVNPESVDVRPVIPRMVNNEPVQFPIFKSVPPIFMYGGSSYEAMPVSVGDYALLHVVARCFDAWYMGQDFVAPLEQRTFDYSDCFAQVGVKPLAQHIPIPNVITRRGDCDIEGAYVHRGSYDLTGDETHLGDKTQTGEFRITGDIILNGRSIDDYVKNHTHSDVERGTDNSGKPNI